MNEDLSEEGQEEVDHHGPSSGSERPYEHDEDSLRTSKESLDYTPSADGLGIADLEDNDSSSYVAIEFEAYAFDDDDEHYQGNPDVLEILAAAPEPHEIHEQEKTVGREVRLEQRASISEDSRRSVVIVAVQLLAIATVAFGVARFFPSVKKVSSYACVTVLVG